MALLLALLYLVYGFFVLYVRAAADACGWRSSTCCIALAPAALGLWILPHTAGWGRHWLRLFMTTVFQQAIQLDRAGDGLRDAQPATPTSAGPSSRSRTSIWKLLLSLAFVYLATRVPFAAGQRRHLRRLAPHPLLRHVPARLDGPLRAQRWGCSWSGRDAAPGAQPGAAERSTAAAGAAGAAAGAGLAVCGHGSRALRRRDLDALRWRRQRRARSGHAAGAAAE